jgi:hypothetical protein
MLGAGVMSFVEHEARPISVASRATERVFFFMMKKEMKASFWLRLYKGDGKNLERGKSYFNSSLCTQNSSLPQATVPAWPGGAPG